MKLLLAEDEDAMRMAIEDVLTFNHYSVTAVSNGKEAVDQIQREHFDGVLLDIMMPGMDGLSVLRYLRESKNPVPVMLLTARGEVEDRVMGLDSGADDYLTKPFAMSELLARIRAMTRRPQLASMQVSAGNVVLDEEKSMLICGEATELLSRIEMNLILLFFQNKGVYFSAEALLDKVWGIDSEAGIGTVWVYISYLRKKLNALGANVEIRSRRGVGYAVEVSEV